MEFLREGDRISIKGEGMVKILGVSHENETIYYMREKSNKLLTATFDDILAWNGKMKNNLLKFKRAKNLKKLLNNGK